MANKFKRLPADYPIEKLNLKVGDVVKVREFEPQDVIGKRVGFLSSMDYLLGLKVTVSYINLQDQEITVKDHQYKNVWFLKPDSLDIRCPDFIPKINLGKLITRLRIRRLSGGKPMPF